MNDKVLTALVCCLTFLASAKSMVPKAEIDTVLTDENVTYRVISDENNVYLKVSTTDEKTMMSMLRLGVSVFFDINGKKKQNVYVKYPLEPMQRQRQQGRREPSDPSSRPEPTSFEEDEANRKKRIMDILENDYSQNAEYGYFDDSEEFHILLNTLDIAAAFTYNDEEGLLEYDLTLPKSKICTDADKDLSKLTIGIMTIKEKRERNNTEGVRANIGGISLGNQQGGGRSGGGKRGPPGGGRGQGGGQGGQQGGPPKGEQGKSADVLLNFWFKANS